MIRSNVLALVLTVLPAAGLVTSAHAQTTTVYRCSAVRGEVVYQGTPCANSRQQQTIQLQNNVHSTTATTAPMTADASAPAGSSVPQPAQAPRTPPPLMYQCINAVNHNTYLSSDGNPPPYYAPLAVTGIVPTPLGQTYAPAGRGSATAATVASHYVQVQDQCEAMTPQDTCSTLRDQYDENERQLSRAFKSDQPPLLKRESELLAKLSHC